MAGAAGVPHAEAHREVRVGGGVHRPEVGVEAGNAEAEPGTQGVEVAEVTDARALASTEALAVAARPGTRATVARRRRKEPRGSGAIRLRTG